MCQCCIRLYTNVSILKSSVLLGLIAFVYLYIYSIYLYIYIYITKEGIGRMYNEMHSHTLSFGNRTYFKVY